MKPKLQQQKICQCNQAKVVIVILKCIKTKWKNENDHMHDKPFFDMMVNKRFPLS
jgi:hypothetical protein